MAGTNPLWAPHASTASSGSWEIEISERTVSRLLAQLSRPPSQPWRTFLANHLSALVSMDFFTVSTLTGRVLFVLVLISHARRRIVLRQRHRAPHLRVDRPAAGRSLPRGLRSPMAAARPGQHLRRSSAAADRQPRHHRGRGESAQPVAESLRGARDRLHSPRVSGPRDHPQRQASPPHASRVSRLLPSEPHASRPEQGRARRQAGVCRCRTDHRLAGGRRLASPLRSSGRVSGRRDACRDASGARRELRLLRRFRVRKPTGCASRMPFADRSGSPLMAPTTGERSFGEPHACRPDHTTGARTDPAAKGAAFG
jgi:hypothetical protein